MSEKGPLEEKRFNVPRPSRLPPVKPPPPVNKPDRAPPPREEPKPKGG